MKKNLANIISSSRILCAIWLFFLNDISSALFLCIYCYCGVSDFIDGPIARKTKTTSLLGTKLDTAGDVVTYFALAKILIVQSLFPVWVLFWLLATIVGFIASAVISKIRLGQFYFVHSFFGKVMGGAAFVIPFIIKIISNLFSLELQKSASIYLGFVCIIASIASIESIVIQLKSKTIQTDPIPFIKAENE